MASALMYFHPDQTAYMLVATVDPMMQTTLQTDLPMKATKRVAGKTLCRQHRQGGHVGDVCKAYIKGFTARSNA